MRLKRFNESKDMVIETIFDVARDAGLRISSSREYYSNNPQVFGTRWTLSRFFGENADTSG